MGYFDLPRGNFELLLKKRGRGCFKSEWRSVMFTDRLSPSEIASCIEEWSVHYKVEGARYNGKPVTPPTRYHWELRGKDGEVLGRYAKRADAKEVFDQRKSANHGKPKEQRVFPGIIEFVQE